MNRQQVLSIIVCLVSLPLNAEVIFTENKKPATQNTIQDLPEIPPASQKKSISSGGAVKHYHIEGYADSNYVKFVLDVESNKIIAGQMINQDQAAKPVHGEIVDDVLHIYDKNGKHFTVIVP